MVAHVPTACNRRGYGAASAASRSSSASELHAPTDARTMPWEGIIRTTIPLGRQASDIRLGIAARRATRRASMRPRGPTSSPRSREPVGEARGQGGARGRAPTPTPPTRTAASMRASRRSAGPTGSRDRSAWRRRRERIRAPCRPGERTVPRPRNEELVDAIRADVQAAAALGTAQPLLSRRGVKVAAEPRTSSGMAPSAWAASRSTGTPVCGRARRRPSADRSPTRRASRRSAASSAIPLRRARRTEPRGS